MPSARLPLTCSVVGIVEAGVRQHDEYLFLIYECGQAKLVDHRINPMRSSWRIPNLQHRCLDLRQLRMLPSAIPTHEEMRTER